MSVPFVDLSRQYSWMKDEIDAALQEVAASGQYVLGSQLMAFEESLAALTDSNFVLGLGNGTDALIIAMRLLGIGTGDEVIVPVNSFIASAGAVTAVGAKPVFCDVGLDHNIDPHKFEQLITERTKAVMVVHLSGKPSEMEKIISVAHKFGIYVVEDSAQAIGASYRGKKVGSLGHLSAFSLHPLKNLSVMGDGGFLSLSCPHLFGRAKQLRNHGLLDRDNCAEWGMNSRLDEIQAAIGLVKLKYFDEITNSFKKIARFYRTNLGDVVTVPVEEDGIEAVYHNFMVLAEDRDNLAKYLADKGVETKIHYPVLLCDQPAFAKYLSAKTKADDFEMARHLNERKLSLPIFAELTEDEQASVVSAIRSFYS